MPFPLVSIVWLIAGLLIAGVLLWAINQIPGIDATIKAVVRVVIIVVVVIWLIYFLANMFTSLPPLGGGYRR